MASPWILRGALAAQVLVVAWIAWAHDPGMSFDESNSLRIARLSASDRQAVLAFDPNLPGYYALIHRLLDAGGGSTRYVILFQFTLWLATVPVFHRLAGRLAARPRTALLATVLYAMTASIYYYAFYVRMYGLAILALLVAFLCFTRYAERQRLRDLCGLGACFVVLACLHPSVALVCPLFLLALRLTTTDRRHLLAAAGFSLAAAALLVVQLAAKADVLQLYFGSAVEYIRATSTEILTRPSQLLFKHVGQTSWALSGVAGFLLFHYARKGAWIAPRNAAIGVFTAAFILAWLFTASFIDSHHYYFVTPPLILAMVLGAEAWMPSRSLRLLPEAMLLLLFAAGSYGFITRHLDEVRRNNVECDTVRGLEDGWILTDYILYNCIDRCVPAGCRVALFTPDGIVDTTPLDARDLLIEQARMGGTCAASLAVQAFQKRLSGLTPQETSRLRKQVIDLARDRGNVYYLTSQTKRYLFPEELEIFRGLSFKGMLRPAVFWFQGRHLQGDAEPR